MPAGRPGKSIEQHKLDGTYRPDRHADIVAGIPLTKVPKMPAQIDRKYRKMWQEMCQQLIDLQVLTVVDLWMLAEYFVFYDMYRNAADNVKEEGHRLTIQGDKGQDRIITNPEVGIMNESWRRCKEILQCFGLSPVDRKKVSIQPTGAAENDPVGDILKPTKGGLSATLYTAKAQ